MSAREIQIKSNRIKYFVAKQIKSSQNVSLLLTRHKPFPPLFSLPTTKPPNPLPPQPPRPHSIAAMDSPHIKSEPTQTPTPNASKPHKFKGIRMRKWGKWVAEIREPNKRTRIWLGSYSSPIAAARAYDTAVFLLRGPTARLNFPDSLNSIHVDVDDEVVEAGLSAVAVRKRAMEVGSRVDAYEAALRSRSVNGSGDCAGKRVVAVKPDLNLYPDPDSSDED